MIKLKPGETVRAIGERGTAKIRSIMTSRHAALLEKQIGGFRNWTLDELRLVKRDRSTEVITLTRPVSKLADRFERLGVDEEGKMDPDDKKLVAKVRKQLDLVLTAPMRELMKPEPKPKADAPAKVNPR